MVPLSGNWTRFSNQEEQLQYFRNWGLISPKSNKLRPVMVTDGYFGAPEPCTVVGYQENYTAVIELHDGLHAIFGEYLAELQPSSPQKLPHGVCFADILSHYIVLDIETTGLDRCQDEIIEIAAVEYRHGNEVGEFHSLIRPQVSIPDNITELTGITDSDIANAPTLDCIKESFLGFVGSTPLVGHNALSFDVPFISNKIGVDLSNIVIDTLTMARKSYPLLHSHKLDYLKDVLELNSSLSHRALNDVHTTNALMWACLTPRRYETLMWKAFLDQKRSPIIQLPAFKSKKSIAKKNYMDAKYNRVDIKSFVPTCSDIDPEGQLFGKNIVFTGELSIPRDKAMQLAVNSGAVLKSSVSGKTAFLVVGNPSANLPDSSGESSKERKAAALNASGKARIEIINESQFLDLVKYNKGDDNNESIITNQ